MNFAIVIITYNAREISLKTLNALRISIDRAKIDFPEHEFETIVIDNASQDGVNTEIKESFEWVKLIESDKNLGFSVGNNLGVKQTTNPDYILFLNNDAVCNPDTLSISIEQALSIDDLGIYTCRVDLWSGGIDRDCHRGFPTIWNAFCYFSGLESTLGKLFPKIFGGYHMLDKDLNTMHEIDVCLGAFMLVPSEIGESIGWWPTDYFLNGEDVDFCYQVKKILNKKIIYDPASTVIHYKGASKGTKRISQDVTTASNETKLLQINSGIESMKIFYDKYYRKNNNFILNLIVDIGMSLLKFKRVLLKSE